MNMFDALSRPFPPEAIHWRAQSVSTKDPNAPKAMALAYIDARDVQRRLDEVCGPANWQCDYPHAGSKTICRIGIKVDGEWIWKANGAGDTDIEAEKGAISDAFKRAAVLWGVGRYLYDLRTPWAACELRNGKWAKWTAQGLTDLRRVAASAVAPVLPRQQTAKNAMIDDAAIAAIAQAAPIAGVSIQAIVEGFNVSALDELTAEQGERTIGNLKKRLAQNNKEAA